MSREVGFIDKKTSVSGFDNGTRCPFKESHKSSMERLTSTNSVHKDQPNRGDLEPLRVLGPRATKDLATGIRYIEN